MSTIGDAEKLKSFYTATVSKLTENLSAEKERVKELTGRVKDLEQTIEDYKRLGSGTSCMKASDKEKKVAELYASGLPSGFIYKMFMEQLHIDMSLNEIEKIVSRLEGDGKAISLDLLNHYVEAKKIFTEKNTVEKGFFASSLYKKFKLLEEEYSILLMIAKDEGNNEERRKIVDLMGRLYQIEASTFSKNTLAIFGKQSVENITKDYDTQVDELFGTAGESKIVAFKKKA